MTNKRCVGAIGFLILVLGIRAGISPPHAEQMYVFHHENVLGTSLELKFRADSLAIAEKSEAGALAEIDRLAKILSSYDRDSEFSKWFRTSENAVAVSPDLFRVMDLFDQWRQRTNGALDASAEGIVRVWKSAGQEQRTPRAEELSAAVEAARLAHWALDRGNGTATHLDRAPLALNSFTKSYIVGQAAEAALESGARAAVVNIGGDLVVRGDWTETVSIADPHSDAENGEPMAIVPVRDRAVATSGDYRRGVEIGGKHYSHIVDPRNGMPADEVISSTVIAQEPSDAGALATAFSVLKPEESRRLARSLSGVEYLIVASNGRRFASPGWSAWMAPQSSSVGASGYELLITLELARIEGERVHRPYVAVWIEDQNKFPVRTVQLWFNKARYLPDMKAWFRDDRTRAAAEGDEIANSISSATRPPGKYTFKWDGKDNKGKLMKRGIYTVFIEAAREHGTYQLLRQEIDCNGVPKQFTLSGNTEISSAALDYRKTEAR